VDCQRAEAHLRLLAEEELRRPAWEWGERRSRVGRVALLLTAMGALDDEVADRILADFDTALVARQPDAPGRRGVAAALYYWPVTWILDNGGRWHATRLLGQSGNALRAEVLPPLSRATTEIEVVATGCLTEARARLPLRWE
jgi:hypothetical protein